MHKFFSKIFDSYCKLKIKINQFINPYEIDEIYIYDKPIFRKIDPLLCHNYAMSETKQHIIFKKKNKYYVRYMRLYRLVDIGKHVIDDYEYETGKENVTKSSNISSILQRSLAKQKVNTNSDNIIVNINDNKIELPMLISKNEMQYRKSYDTDMNMFIILLLVLGKQPLDIKIQNEIVAHDKVLI